MSDVSSILARQTAQEGSQASQARQSLSNDFDNFLTLLTAQLQNQDPLSPTDTNEFTNQIVSFSQLEQTINQNSNLEELVSLQRGNQATGALDYIGKEVDADTNLFSIQNGKAVDITYTMPEEAKSGALVIYNELDEVVSVAPLEKRAGTHTYSFDPAAFDEGDQIADGNYRFQVEAINTDDIPIEQDDLRYQVTGLVTGVEFANGQTTINMGGSIIPVENVLKINLPAQTTGTQTEPDSSSDQSESETSEDNNDQPVA